ncbi:MAG: RNA 2',3'-cyclic phosphodiesterase [Candidatus Aegiribacteria sp.]|nr:RNA 2',3'-cyclic phosphodiesterase [Candidatus Aegiribacteria sp.]
MRIFAALELPLRVRSEITDWQKPLKARYPSLKWIRGDNMHLTLRFFGDIRQNEVDRICGLLSSWHPGPLEFSLDSIGSFGKRESPSVFWLGGSFPEEVSRMACELGRIPDEKGQKCVNRFVPHLTFARRRNSTPLPNLDPPCETRGLFEEAVVINSRLTSGGSEYTFIERYDLH